LFVNGQLEFEHGKLTGVKAGVPLHGPGWKPVPSTAQARNGATH
jgi:hypothetical protein